MLVKVIAGAALAIAVAVAVIIFAIPKTSGGPNLKFTDYAADRLDIRVGESTNIIFNVQNLESRAITDAKVITMIEPSSYQPYLLIDKPTINLPTLQSKDARTGQMQITITAANAPAKEAVYTIKGVLFAEGKESDLRELELRIRS